MAPGDLCLVAIGARAPGAGLCSNTPSGSILLAEGTGKYQDGWDGMLLVLLLIVHAFSLHRW